MKAGEESTGEASVRVRPAGATSLSTWRPRLVALDVDGTLLDVRNRASDAVRDAVDRVLRSGAHVVLSTGRGLVATRPIAQSFDLDRPYVVCSNGAVTARLQPVPEFCHIVTFDAGPILRHLLDRLPEALVAVEEVGVGYRVNRPFPEGELTGRITIETVEQLVSRPATRVIIREPGSEAEDFLDLVDRIGLQDVTYYVGYTAWLDLAPEGVSKAAGLQLVAGRLGVDVADVLAIGDGRNDVEMLGWAGRGVAMGNAPPEVQDAADDVTETIEEDGAAVELDRWFG